MSLSLTLQAQPGDDIETTSRELQATANRLGLTCEVKFNDFKLVASAGGDAQHLIDGFLDWVRAPGSVKLAFSSRRLVRNP